MEDLLAGNHARFVELVRRQLSGIIGPNVNKSKGIGDKSFEQNSRHIKHLFTPNRWNSDCITFVVVQMKQTNKRKLMNDTTYYFKAPALPSGYTVDPFRAHWHKASYPKHTRRDSCLADTIISRVTSRK